MEIFEMKRVDDETRFYLNAAHVIAVTGEGEECRILTSDGKTYLLSEKSGKTLRHYLQGDVKISLETIDE